MGRGGAMRTAAKVASIGVASAGIRGAPVASPAKQSVRQASRPVSAVLSSQGAKAAEVAPLHSAASSDLDDCEHAFDDEPFLGPGDVMPRVVFGNVPSFQEAKEATSVLKDAIENVYLSSNSSKCEGSSTGSEVTVHSPLLSGMETKSCVLEAISTPIPKDALQALKFLSTSSEARTIVASVASDPSVWDAIMQNSILNDFIQSHKKAASFEAEKPREKMEDLYNSDQSGKRGNGFTDFMDIVQNIKFTVTGMVSSASNYLNNIFGFSMGEKTSSDANVNTKANFMDPIAMGGTLMGLAILVVMIVFLKRA